MSSTSNFGSSPSSSFPNLCWERARGNNLSISSPYNCVALRVQHLFIVPRNSTANICSQRGVRSTYSSSSLGTPGTVGSAMPVFTKPWGCPLCQFLQQRPSWSGPEADGTLEWSPSCWERNAFSIVIILSLFQCLCDLVTPHNPSLFMNGLLYHGIGPLNGLRIRCLMLGQHFSSAVVGSFPSTPGTSCYRAYMSACLCLLQSRGVLLMVHKSLKNLYWIILLDAGLWLEWDDLLTALHFIDFASPVGSGSLSVLARTWSYLLVLVWEMEF